MNEMPSITASTYSSSALNTALMLGAREPPDFGRLIAEAQAARPANVANLAQVFNQGANQVSTARIVKVFIADPNDNLPLDKRVIYSGEEKLTDSTDQELFFEVPIGDLLAKQNELRSTTLDKKASEKSGRDIFLEPARIRDLKMVVVTVAQF